MKTKHTHTHTHIPHTHTHTYPEDSAGRSFHVLGTQGAFNLCGALDRSSAWIDTAIAYHVNMVLPWTAGIDMGCKELWKAVEVVRIDRPCSCFVAVLRSCARALETEALKRDRQPECDGKKV